MESLYTTNCCHIVISEHTTKSFMQDQIKFPSLNCIHIFVYAVFII